MIKKFETFEMDPYNEELWEDEVNFKFGDILICVFPGKTKLEMDKEYFCRGMYQLGGRVNKIFVNVTDPVTGHEYGSMNPYRFKKKIVE